MVARREIQRLLVLDVPARLGQTCVNLVAGELLGILVLATL